MRRGRWSDYDTRWLENCYGGCSEAALVQRFRRPIRSIHRRATEIFSIKKSRAGAAWEAAEDERLKMCLGVSPIPTIARVLRRDEPDVRGRISALALSIRSGALTGAECARLKQIYGTRDNEMIAVILGREIDEICKSAGELALAKDKAYLKKQSSANGHHATARRETNGAAHADDKNNKNGTPGMPRWTDDKIAVLREIYPNNSNVDVAKMLGKSSKSIMSKAHDLDIKKSAEFLAKMGRINVGKRYESNGKAKHQLNPPPPPRAAEPRPPEREERAAGNE